MPALDNPKREAFALNLLRNLISGEFRFRGDAAFAAAKAAGYRGSALKDNARKWANEADVKGRMAEVAAPIKPAAAEANPELLMDIGEAKLTLAKIARYAKPADRIGSIRQLSLMEGWDAPTRHEHTAANGQPLFDISKLNDEQLSQLETIHAALAPLLAAIAGSDPAGDGVPASEGQLH